MQHLVPKANVKIVKQVADVPEEEDELQDFAEYTPPVKVNKCNNLLPPEREQVHYDISGPDEGGEGKGKPAVKYNCLMPWNQNENSGNDCRNVSYPRKQAQRYRNAESCANSKSKYDSEEIIYMDENFDDLIEEVYDTATDNSEKNVQDVLALTSPENVVTSCGCAIGLTAAPLTDLRIHSPLKNDTDTITEQCANPTYKCTMPRVEQSKFCQKHLLYGEKGIYVACKYKYETGRRCTTAIKNDGERIYCVEHFIELNEKNSKAIVLKPVHTNEYHLQQLQKHIHIDQEVLEKERLLEKEEDYINVENVDGEPFIPHANVDSLENVLKNTHNRSDVNELDSITPDDEPRIQNTVRYCDDVSDDELSVDSDDNDPLKHSVVYTHEEVLKVTCKKAERLRELYLGEIENLRSLLRTRRQTYIQEIRKECETLCSIKDQHKHSPEEQKYYAELKAFNSYHRHNGTNGLLKKKYKDKRGAGSSDCMIKSPGPPICYFIDEFGVKCQKRSIPCTKYCAMHITQDTKQLLFRICGKKNGDVICKNPIILGLDDACSLHRIAQNETVITSVCDEIA